MKHSAAWWSIVLPDQWAKEEDEACMTFIPPAKDAALQISAYRNNTANPTNDTLREFAQDQVGERLNLSDVEVGGWTGYSFIPEEDGMFSKQWLLRSGATMLYITYSSRATDLSKDHLNGIESILGSLKVNA